MNKNCDNNQKDCCSICLEDLNETDSTKTTTSCFHSYHKDCLMTWRMKSKTCPMCRKPLELFKKTAHSHSNLNGTIDELIEVLGEPRRMPSDDLDGTRIEWDYHPINGNYVTIYGYQQGMTTSDYMPFFEEGNDRVDCLEIFVLLRDEYIKKHSLCNNYTV